MINTWLPSPDFRVTATMLSNGHLCKQRSDAYRILLSLCYPLAKGNSPYKAPRSLMPDLPIIQHWTGFTPLLVDYISAMCDEYFYRHTLDEDPIWAKAYSQCIVPFDLDYAARVEPFWLHHPLLHSSHRSNLLRLNKEHYSDFGWDEDTNEPYFWPMLIKKQ